MSTAHKHTVMLVLGHMHRASHCSTRTCREGKQAMGCSGLSGVGHSNWPLKTT